MREFANREGISVTNVYMALQKGKLSYIPGTRVLDPALLGTWRKARRDPTEVTPQDEDIASVIDRGASKVLKLAESDRVKAYLDIQKKKREHDLAMGKVVLVEDVEARLVRIFSEIRVKLTSLPSEHAPQIAALTTAPEVQDYLATILTEALEVLSK